MSATITATEFKTFFDRGQFTYGITLPDIRDKDIDEAIAEAQAIFNEDIYPNEDTAKQALYYLTAHFLLLDIDSSNSGGQSNFIQSSRSANGISESLTIPEWMLNGDYALYVTTFYGQKFLMLSKPYLDGVIFSVTGGTRY
jgi:hypothetical protein